MRKPMMALSAALLATLSASGCKETLSGVQPIPILPAEKVSEVGASTPVYQEMWVITTVTRR